MSLTAPRTFIIVDDSPEFLDAARQLLEDDGMTVIGVAATADEALATASTLQPDVVLVDIDLGSESGFDVARRLAALNEGAPQVILISAESETELAELVAASGARGFISKTDLSVDEIERLLPQGGRS
jgi:DNA-binding NarL/FixJ family response regulator